MRTIGYRHAGRRRDHTAICDYCGVAWLRSDLTGPDDDGYFRCPDDRDGRAVKTLDYQRALNASEPQLVEGVRDRPGQSPPFDSLIGWAWIDRATGKSIAGNLQASHTIFKSNYLVTGGAHTTAAVYHYDAFDPSIGRYYTASRQDAVSIKVAGWSLVLGPDFIPGAGGHILVLAYSKSGGEGVLTETAWAWVHGSAGTLIDSSGDVTVARTSTGLYTLTTATPHKVATVNQFSQTDVSLYAQDSSVAPVIVWGGKTGASETKVRSVSGAGVQTDTDFLIRFLA